MSDPDLPDEPSESDTDYDGFLSWSGEWHALTHGVYKGLTSKALVTPPVPEFEDVEKEPHYYRGGYVIGTLLQVALLVAAVVAGGGLATGLGF